MSIPVGIEHRVPFLNQWHWLIQDSGGSMWEKVGTEYVKQDRTTSARWSNTIRRFEDNRCSYFLPHGGGKDFINDWESGIPMLVAPVRSGKSTHGVIFGLLRTIPMSKDWHCVKYHGVEYRSWRGPRKLVVSSYSWSNLEELWKEYQKWCPRSELGPYAMDWGSRGTDEGQAKTLSFRGSVNRVTLKCGSELLFLCDNQKLGPWEGKRWDDGHFDEQRMRDKFISYLRGTQNTQGLVQASMTLTGYMLPDRPDTGAGGWIHRDLWNGRYSFGRTVGRYQITMDEVPDAIMSAEVKQQLYKQWVEEPERMQDAELMKKGKARYFGGWEEGGGLVIGNFYPETHVIPPYARHHRIVEDATKYRGVDHGLGRPCAAVLLEVFPWGDMVVYNEYYEHGKSVPYHCKKIVAMCGNRIVANDDVGDIGIDEMESWRTWSEEEVGTELQASVLDGRSFASPSQERPCTLGQLYNDYGLNCTAASGARNFSQFKASGQLERLKALLTIEADRPHIMWQFWKKGIIDDAVYQEWLDNRGGDWKHGARLYVQSTCHFLIDETLQWKYGKTGKPEEKGDHLIGGALKYVISSNPVYFGQYWDDMDEESQNP